MQTARKTGNETALSAALTKALAEKKPTAQTKALRKAVAKAGSTPDDRPRPAKEKRFYRRHQFNKNVSWGRADFGTMTISMHQFEIGKEDECGPYVWTHIKRAQHTPKQMQLDFTAELPDGIVLLHAQGGNVTDVTGAKVPSLPVYVNWRDGRQEDSDKVPHSRKTDADNVDFVFMRKSDGKFIQIQVSIVTRRGAFYVAIQEIWAGQVVRTTMDNAGTLETTVHTVKGQDGRDYGAVVAPLFDDNAYPGADYLKTFKNMGPKVIDYANVNGMTAPLSSAVVAEWTPEPVEGLSEQMITDGWKTGIVTFFNLVVNYGFIKADDGRSYFVYGDNIVEDDMETPVVKNFGFPVVEPMKGVVFKVGPSKKPGTVQAVNVYQPA